MKEVCPSSQTECVTSAIIRESILVYFHSSPNQILCQTCVNQRDGKTMRRPLTDCVLWLMCGDDPRGCLPGLAGTVDEVRHHGTGARLWDQKDGSSHSLTRVKIF